MSETAIQSYLHSLLQCSIDELPVFAAADVPAEVQSWLAESAERQQDFALLMEAARQEPFITEYACGWDINHVLDGFRGDEGYGWKELMSSVDAVGCAIDEGDAEREQLGMAIVRLLLEAGDSPNNDYAIALYSGPLHYACQNGYLQLAELLLRYGADPNMEDADMHTPLHFAARNNQLDCAALLIKHGAIVDAPDIAGWTPLRGAILCQHENMAALLQKHGARITEFSKKDWDCYKKTKNRHNG